MVGKEAEEFTEKFLKEVCRESDLDTDVARNRQMYPDLKERALRLKSNIENEISKWAE